MEKEIVLKFDLETGECVIEAKGFKGSSCAEATKFLKDTLGQCTDFQRKAEWFEKNVKTFGRVYSNLCG